MKKGKFLAHFVACNDGRLRASYSLNRAVTFQRKNTIQTNWFR